MPKKAKPYLPADIFYDHPDRINEIMVLSPTTFDRVNIRIIQPSCSFRNYYYKHILTFMYTINKCSLNLNAFSKPDNDNNTKCIYMLLNSLKC